MSLPLFNDIVQIGIVVRDADTCIAKYRELLNLQDWHINYVDTATGKGSNFRNGQKPVPAKAKIAWIRIGNVELEVIEPRDKDSVYARFLREKGPGIHHVMFATPDYDKCSAVMAENNVGVIGSGELQQTRFQMFDTKEELGLICEIADGEPLIPDESLGPLQP
jgi:catechol 2,3-dioxygenase-like lactoylglutathione lyase family enzyme